MTALSSISFEKNPITEISSVFTVHSQKGETTKMDSRKSYGLALCIDGQITYVQRGVEYTSTKGTAVILPKGESYLIRRDRTGNFPLINFDCAKPLCDTVTLIKTENEEQLLSLYKKIKSASCMPESSLRIFSLFYEMLDLLTEDRVPFILQKAVRRINEEYGNASLSNEALAEECGISEVYFRRLFTSHLGTSPKQYIIELRIRQAKEMLTEGTASVSTVAERCGFSNPYHFARLFKEHEGLTPSEYRRKSRIYDI